jgi:antitoxin component of MazEF toxin-antitoxin module
MEHIVTQIKKWGNSLGVVIPKDVVNQKNLKENSQVFLTIESRDRMTVEDVLKLAKKFKLKRKGNTQQILDEIDKELWPGDE